MLRTLSLVGFCVCCCYQTANLGLWVLQEASTLAKLLSNDAYGTKKYEYYNEGGSWPCQEIDLKELKLIKTILSIRRTNLFVDRCGWPCKGYMNSRLRKTKGCLGFFFFFLFFFLFTLRPYLAMTVLKAEWRFLNVTLLKRFCNERSCNTPVLSWTQRLPWVPQVFCPCDELGASATF